MAQGHSGGIRNPWFLASRSCAWMDSINWRCETKEDMPLFFQRLNAVTDAAIRVQQVPFTAAPTLQAPRSLSSACLASSESEGSQ